MKGYSSVRYMRHRGWNDYTTVVQRLRSHNETETSKLNNGEQTCRLVLFNFVCPDVGSFFSGTSLPCSQFFLLYSNKIIVGSVLLFIYIIVDIGLCRVFLKIRNSLLIVVYRNVIFFYSYYYCCVCVFVLLCCSIVIIRFLFS